MVWAVKGAGVAETTGKWLGNAPKPPKTLLKYQVMTQVEEALGKQSEKPKRAWRCEENKDRIFQCKILNFTVCNYVHRNRLIAPRLT